MRKDLLVPNSMQVSPRKAEIVKMSSPMVPEK